jgi:hypothetical protein
MRDRHYLVGDAGRQARLPGDGGLQFEDLGEQAIDEGG